jgi:hypothetical protein
MALAENAPRSQQQTRRTWRKPKSRAIWLWLIFSVLLYGGVSYWNFIALKTQPYPYPSTDPFRLFGIIAFALVVLVAAYSLRRRFVRTLPGRVEDWLWLHTWFGIISILIALQHEAYAELFGNLYLAPSTFTQSAFGVTALYGLMLLVTTGVVGRLLDVWQARVIAVEANRNGVGIVQSVEERLHELDLLIVRLSAGKSAVFKEICEQARRGGNVPSVQSSLPLQEQEDFKRVHDAFILRSQLVRSLRRQKRARFVIRGWRYVHITCACIGLFFIGVHSLIELAKLLLGLIMHH